MNAIRFSRRHVAISVLLASCFLPIWPGLCLGQNQQAEGQKALRILYVGHPDSNREQDFTGFLSQHFAVVDTGDLKGFKESQCEGYDVTILDYDGDGFKAPRVMVSRNLSRPVVTVGVAGAMMCSQWGLKTGYL